MAAAAAARSGGEAGGAVGLVVGRLRGEDGGDAVAGGMVGFFYFLYKNCTQKNLNPVFFILECKNFYL